MPDLQTFLDIRELLAGFLQEDIGTGDVTSNSIIPDNLDARAEIICKSRPTIVCGLNEARIIFDICGCTTDIVKGDGSRVKRGDVVMKVLGNARAILMAERVALNIIMRMSGIATETSRVARRVKGVKILATRKTAPGLRYFDKKAVAIGGGGAHRMRLDDMVLIKDNHLVLTDSLEACIRLAKKNVGSSIKVECEARNLKEAIEAASAGADIVMLDNFTPKQAASAIKQISIMGMRNKVQIEISGGINRRNISQYARAKPDFISLGYLTHSPKVADFSLEIRR